MTFAKAAPSVAPASSVTITTISSESFKPVVVVISQDSTIYSTSAGLTVSTISQPTSILKTASSAAATTTASCSSVAVSSENQTVKSATENSVVNYDPMKLRSSTAASCKPSSFITTEISQADAQPSSLAELSSVSLPSESKSGEAQIKEDLEALNESSSDVKQEQMDTTEASCDPDTKLTVKVENCLESDAVLQGSSAGGGNAADVTKPLSIETKFNTSPCAASSESTDTASEIGSGFSSPGSLNTSSCQSSPQFSDGNTTGGMCYVSQLILFLLFLYHFVSLTLFLPLSLPHCLSPLPSSLPPSLSPSFSCLSVM